METPLDSVRVDVRLSAKGGATANMARSRALVVVGCAAMAALVIISVRKPATLSSRIDHGWRLVQKDNCVSDARGWYQNARLQAWNILRQQNKGAHPSHRQWDATFANLLKGRRNEVIKWSRPEWIPYAIYAAENNDWYFSEDWDVYWGDSCMNVPLAQHLTKIDAVRRAELERLCRTAKPSERTYLYGRLSVGRIKCVTNGRGVDRRA